VEPLYAQVFELPGAEQSEPLDRTIQCELLPALRSENGFCGAVSLVRRDAREMLLLVFWETETQAVRPLVPALVGFLDEAGARGFTSGPPGVWEVGARA
jgi:hypothetical protein